MTVVTQGPFGGAQELPHEGDGAGAASSACSPRRAIRRRITPRITTRARRAPRSNHSPRRRSGSSAPIRCRSRWSITLKRPLPGRDLRRRHRPGRSDQGDQEPGGDGADRAHRPHAGRRHEGGLRRHQAGHARPRRGRRSRSTTARPMAASRDSISAPLRRRPARALRPQAHAEPRHPRRATSSRCWSKTAAPGGFYTELGRSCVVGKAPRR